MENCRRTPVHPVSAIRGGERDAVIDKLGRLRQKGLMRKELKILVEVGRGWGGPIVREQG